MGTSGTEMESRLLSLSLFTDFDTEQCRVNATSPLLILRALNSKKIFYTGPDHRYPLKTGLISNGRK